MTEDSSSQIERFAHQIVCLRNISKLFSESGKEVDEVLDTLVHLLPEGWQYPAATCIRITLGDRTIQSTNFQEANWTQSAEIWTHGTKIGSLEIYYLEEKPEAQEGPFLSDERILIDTVAAELGSYLERKDMERIMRQQYRELELYASLLKHDLRNDVGVIIGNVEIAKLAITNRDEAIDELLSSTEAVCERMINLLNAVGRASKVAESNLVPMVEKIASLAEEASIGLKVTVTVDEQVRGVQITGSKLLPLVFDNLLRNAATHAGTSPEVQISMTREGGFVSIIVADDGPGIAKEIREKLFHKGVSTRGGGLGLYLSKAIVDALGGSIELVDSEEGEGATFRILLPTVL
jgi:signal transduction histidine kinase